MKYERAHRANSLGIDGRGGGGGSGPDGQHLFLQLKQLGVLHAHLRTGTATACAHAGAKSSRAEPFHAAPAV